MASTQPQFKEDKMRVVWVLAFLALAGLAIYTYFTSGTAGVGAMVKKFIIYAIILVVVGLVVWIVMKLLEKPKVDLVANDRRDIIEAALLSKPPMLKDLYVTGDKDHGEFRLGKIVGYCQIQSYKDLDILAGLTPAQLEEMDERGEIPSSKILKEDVFVFKRFMFPISLFESPKVLRTFEDEHSQLVGDVKIYAVSIVQKYSYMFPNRGFLDIARIDISIIREAWRGQIHQYLRDAVSLQQRAVGLDPDHRRELEQRKLLKIPSPLGEDAGRSGKQ
jgi:hypothetical protein